MNKEETDLIIAEQNKSTEEILKAVAKVKSDYHELCNLKDMRIAELEKQLGMSNKVYNDNLDYSHHIEEQFTKAKEIIKELLSSCFGYNSKTVNYEVKAKAEQFLKE